MLELAQKLPVLGAEIVCGLHPVEMARLLDDLGEPVLHGEIDFEWELVYQLCVAVIIWDGLVDPNYVTLIYILHQLKFSNCPFNQFTICIEFQSLTNNCLFTVFLDNV